MKTELQLYELILLLKFNLSEKEATEKLELYTNFLTEKGSQVVVQNHGKRALAYPIENFDTATYFQMVYLGNGELLKQLNTLLQRDESILRSVTTKLGNQNVSEMASNFIK